jgi:steroid 5-alpha reductase family enzyme
MTAFIESRPLLAAALCALVALAALAFCTWLVSLAKRDVSIVDSVWSLMILLAAAVYALALPQTGDRAGVVLALTALWALRLAGYITWRNHGAGEDRRYQDIRARNQPHFEWKSLYLVFGLQAVLAWLVSLSLLAAMVGVRAWGWLDTLGVAIVVFGIAFETLADAQLAAFKAKPENHGRVMDSGLWRYTRHPNYFGEFCVWWGFYLMALSAGAWWALVSPLLMSVLLLKVSGVMLLEKDIAERRPAYRDYVARTNAFFPGRPKA